MKHQDTQVLKDILAVAERLEKRERAKAHERDILETIALVESLPGGVPGLLQYCDKLGHVKRAAARAAEQEEQERRTNSACCRSSHRTCRCHRARSKMIQQENRQIGTLVGLLAQAGITGDEVMMEGQGCCPNYLLGAIADRLDRSVHV